MSDANDNNSKTDSGKKNGKKKSRNNFVINKSNGTSLKTKENEIVSISSGPLVLQWQKNSSRKDPGDALDGVSPSESLLSGIRETLTLMDPLLMTMNLRTDIPQLGFKMHPLTTSRQVSYLGAFRAGGRIHMGDDLLAKVGEVCRTNFSGVIAYVSGKGVGAYNNSTLAFRDPNNEVPFVVMTNNEGFLVKYLYVTPSVKAGQVVELGDVIGTVYDIRKHYTQAMPVHVHYEIVNKEGKAVNPLPWLYGKKESLSWVTDIFVNRIITKFSNTITGDGFNFQVLNPLFYDLVKASWRLSGDDKGSNLLSSAIKADQLLAASDTYGMRSANNSSFGEALRMNKLPLDNLPGYGDHIGSDDKMDVINFTIYDELLAVLGSVNDSFDEVI